MHQKKQKSKKHHPTRYLKYKGCFGNNGYKNTRSSKRSAIIFPSILRLGDDKAMRQLLGAIKYSLEDGTRIVDFSKLEVVEITCGIILRAYADEFQQIYNHAIKVIKPINKKAEAILRYLHVMEPNESYKNYPDLECWNILVFDKMNEHDKNIVIGDKLVNEFIPNCWRNHDYADKESQAVASAVAEIYFNCAEHAYADFCNDDFQKWYIGAGEYPNSKNFVFCIFDRGQGFKRSMQKNIALWGIIRDVKDSFYLKKAANGCSGLDNAEENGRGKGISTSISRIKEVNGDIVLMSGSGEYSSYTFQSRERKLYLRGSLVTFFVPIERASKTCLMSKRNERRKNS